MRKIGSLKEQVATTRFLSCLLKKDIKATCETHGEAFDIWVYEEEDVAQAESIFQEFCKNPDASQFLSSLEAQDTSSSLPTSPEGGLFSGEKRKIEDFIVFAKKRRLYARSKVGTVDITKGIIGVCLFLYMILGVGLGGAGQKQVQAQVLYWTKYEVPEISQRGGGAFTSIKRPWIGYVPLWIQKAQGRPVPESLQGDYFLQIKKGEVWRLVTPCLLHIGFLHFLFNILWLWMLGFQVERILGHSRYLVLLILVGAFSNTVQYLLSGPNFLGLSGVICGLIGFIWMRQKKAPREGYVLDRGTLQFVLIFVLGMAALEIFSIGGALLQVSTVSTSIANSAHIAGGIAGLLLGRSSAFGLKE